MKEIIEDLFEEIPKVDIGFFPTPLQRLDNLSEKYDIDLFMKRDDLSGPGFGGNKVRKLEFIIAEALESGCDYIITYGGYQSNHCRQLTAACNKFDIEPVLFLIGDEEPEEFRANLHLDKIMDAEINFVLAELDDIGKSLDKAMEEGQRRIKELEEQGHICYDCPSGGFDPNGTLGFVWALGELLEQLDELGEEVDYIVHANGTGGTYTGLMIGKKILGLDVEIVPFSVSPMFPDLKNKISMMSEKVGDKLSCEDSVIDPDEVEIDTDHYGPGYDIPYEGSIRATKELAREEGVFLGPAYTAKAMAGLLDYLERGKIEKGRSVVFWHTGGTPAIFAEEEMVGDLYDR
ncbi:MAG: 1-aminocyclopropane-1-carboxylate deaminase/D-cysteine desulfhydrase [Thermoplasmata archaeon]